MDSIVAGRPNLLKSVTNNVGRKGFINNYLTLIISLPVAFNEKKMLR